MKSENKQFHINTMSANEVTTREDYEELKVISVDSPSNGAKSADMYCASEYQHFENNLSKLASFKVENFNSILIGT